MRLVDSWVFNVLNDNDKWSRKQSLSAIYSLLSGGRSLKDEGCLSFKDLKILLFELKPGLPERLGSNFSVDERLEVATKLLNGIKQAERRGNLVHVTSTANLLTLAFADSTDKKVFSFLLNALREIQNDKVGRTLMKAIGIMYESRELALLP